MQAYFRFLHGRPSHNARQGVGLGVQTRRIVADIAGCIRTLRLEIIIFILSMKHSSGALYILIVILLTKYHAR